MGAEDGGGSHGADRLNCGAESSSVNLVDPRTVDGRPQELKVANLVADARTSADVASSADGMGPRSNRS
jgi:hypothetical protein